MEKKFKYFVQLASFKYKKQAEDLQKDFLNYEDKIFKNLNYTISLVDVKNRGIYFRLMAGPFQTKLKASQVCENMKKKSISCITIKEF